MKKLFVLILALCVCMSMTAFAQGGSMAADKPAKAEKAAPLKSLVGTIGADGKSFVTDKDKDKTWAIKNPDDVKGHEGHHVKLSAHVYEKDKAIHVMKVEMMTEKAEGKKKSSM